VSGGGRGVGWIELGGEGGGRGEEGLGGVMREKGGSEWVYGDVEGKTAYSEETS